MSILVVNLQTIFLETERSLKFTAECSEPAKESGFVSGYKQIACRTAWPLDLDRPAIRGLTSGRTEAQRSGATARAGFISSPVYRFSLSILPETEHLGVARSQARRPEFDPARLSVSP
jgi:hypothetical protein